MNTQIFQLAMNTNRTPPPVTATKTSPQKYIGILFVISVLYTSICSSFADGATGHALTQTPSLLNTAYTTKPGESTHIGYGAGILVPELREFRDFAVFAANWRWAVNPGAPGRSRYPVAVNTMVDKSQETKTRMDLKGWVQTLLIQGSSSFVTVDPHLSREEAMYLILNTNLANAASTNLVVPYYVVEAEVATFDEGVLAKRSGFRVDFLLGSTNTIVKDPSLGHEKFLNNSTVIVHARVKHFRSGVYEEGASAIVAATLAEKGQNLNLGLQVQDFGPEFFSSIRVAPAVQQAIVRCGSRAVMIALSRATKTPYWHLFREFPEDEVVKEGLRQHLDYLDTNELQVATGRIESVLADPLQNPASANRPDVNRVLTMLTPGSANNGVNPLNNSGALASNEVLVGFVGFPESKRVKLVAELERATAERVVRVGGWSYKLSLKSVADGSKGRRRWADRLAKSVSRSVGQPCEVARAEPAAFTLASPTAF